MLLKISGKFSVLILARTETGETFRWLLDQLASTSLFFFLFMLADP